ncbi:MAG: glycerol-3-phosphate 1-O-acyltransferase PlsY [Rhodocyclaceae bacterium]|nr:glycerol-3-phosphate 1-O-acyltransferase PlsY [Rhodocyclaceae bacterium]MBX3667665.1 glycerol-3-phosphate 1-O-acyltransferase PlsY [Rhodocyclaceae bacterium]
MSFLICALIGYALGCLPFAVIVSRVMGLQDPRQYGSGNPGATNVLRSGNKRAALFTLAGDALKGVTAVIVVRYFAGAIGLNAAEPDTGALLAGFAAFVGHVFPITLGFKGGKGVATAAGVLLSATPVVGLIVLSVWLGVAILTRYSSLAAICAALAAPIAGGWLLANVQAVALLATMSALLIWRHKDNIRRLLAGAESRIGQKKKT